jgi:hypothetical protein
MRTEIEGVMAEDNCANENSCLIGAILDAWVHWLADPEFSPSDEALLVNPVLMPEGNRRG